jgi:anti-anti-sigma regulatory factor
MRAAMARVWAIYDADLDQIQRDIRERLATHPAFGPLLRDTPVDEEQEAAGHERLRSAMLDWRWEGYWQNTREQAAGYANAEIPLASWVELVNLFRHDLLARVFAHGDTEHLLEDIQALDRWLDDAIAAFAQAFVSANEGVIASQQQAIRSLSTPVLQLHPGLLILPMVGALALLLQAVGERRARAVVLDVTGVPEIDSVAANQLIGSVTSARMMGAEVIISGLSAEIAQTLVTVGIDLSLVVSAGDLQGGIELAERHLAGVA